MHVFWAQDDYFLDDDIPAKRAGRIVKGRMRVRGKLLICRNWAGYMFKGRVLPAATKLILLAAAYGRGPYIFKVIDGARSMIHGKS